MFAVDYPSSLTSLSSSQAAAFWSCGYTHGFYCTKHSSHTTPVRSSTVGVCATLSCTNFYNKLSHSFNCTPFAYCLNTRPDLLLAVKNLLVTGSSLRSVKISSDSNSSFSNTVTVPSKETATSVISHYGACLNPSEWRESSGVDSHSLSAAAHLLLPPPSQVSDCLLTSAMGDHRDSSTGPEQSAKYHHSAHSGKGGKSTRSQIKPQWRGVCVRACVCVCVHACMRACAWLDVYYIMLCMCRSTWYVPISSCLCR